MRLGSLIVSISLLLGLQVLASSGNQAQNSSSSEADGGNKVLDYDKLDPSLQKAVQVYQELETMPTCNSMALKALVHTCTTFKEGDESQDSTEKVLEEEKKLFAARFTICELSDSNDQAIIPRECSSFFTIEADTQKKGWWGSVPTRRNSVPSYPFYDQATRQDLDHCVAALHKSPQAWSSYSNAKQSASHKCADVRRGIEYEEFLHKHRKGVEAVVLNADALRNQSETLRQQEAAVLLMNDKLREMSRDLANAFRSMWSEVQQQMHKGVQTYHDAVQESIDRNKASIQDQQAMSEEMWSAARAALANYTTEVAVAQNMNAEDTRNLMAFAAEMCQKQLMQILSTMNDSSQALIVQNSEALRALERTHVRASELEDRFEKFEMSMDNMTEKYEDRFERMGTSMDKWDRIISKADGYLVVFQKAIGTLGHLPAMAWYVGCSVIILGMCLLLTSCVGGQPLLQMLGSIFSLASIPITSIVRGSAKLVEFALPAAAHSLHEAGIKDVVLMLLAVFCFAAGSVWLTFIEIPVNYVILWAAGAVSLLECAFVVTTFLSIVTLFFVVIVVCLHCLMERFKRVENQDVNILPEHEAKSYVNGQNHDSKESVV